MSDVFVSPSARSRSGGGAARGQIRAFITELVQAGIRPAHHRRGPADGERPSIVVVGWSLGGCRGLGVHCCGPGCELIVTTNAKLVALGEQPPHTRWRRARPVYVDLTTCLGLGEVLAAGRSMLLPRAHAA